MPKKPKDQIEGELIEVLTLSKEERDAIYRVAKQRNSWMTAPIFDECVKRISDAGDELTDAMIESVAIGVLSEAT